MSARNSDPWTVQKRFGFQDDDLKTNLHDQIILWLDQNIREVVSTISEIKPYWTDGDKSKLNEDFQSFKSHHERNYYDESRKALIKQVQLPQDLPEKPDFTIEQVVWEKPIASGNYIVGFVDLFVSASVPRLYIGNSWGQFSPKDAITVTVGQETVFVCLEAKGYIESMGQLIRQIRMYQQYSLDPRWQRGTDVRWAVVSPDNQYEKALNSQGIYFVKYEG